MQNLEKSLKAMANRRRLAICSYLKRRGEAPVYEITEAIHLSIRSTSRHLRVLSAAAIVEHDQRGLLVYYSLALHPSAIVRHILALL